MKYVKKKLSELKPYENNPRINDEAVDDVAESIKQCSYIAPIIIDEDGVILAGHTRYKALKKLGYKECEVVIASDLTEEQKKKYRLYDNKTAEMASWDQKKLSAELCDVDFQGYDFGQPEMALPDEAEEDGEGILISWGIMLLIIAIYLIVFRGRGFIWLGGPPFGGRGGFGGGSFGGGSFGGGGFRGGGGSFGGGGAGRGF